MAVGVLFVASAVLAAHWLAELAADTRLNPALPAVAVGTLLVNPLLLSTVGLEPYLTAALLAGLLRYGVARRPVAFGVLAGLCVLARPDTAVVVVVVALVLPPGVAAGDRGGARGHPALVRVQLVRARLGAAGHAVDEGQRRLGRVRVLERAGALPAQVPGGHGAVVPARARRADRVGRAAGRAPAGGVGAGRRRGRPWRGRPLRRLLPAAHRALPLVLRPVDHRDDVLRGDRRRPRAVGGGGGRRAGLRRAGGRPAARRAVDPRRDLDELGHGRRVRADGHRRGADRRRGRGREPRRDRHAGVLLRLHDRRRLLRPRPHHPRHRGPRAGGRRSARPSCGSTTCTSTATRRPGPSSTGCATRRTSRPRGPSSGAWTTGWTGPAASCSSDEFALRRRSTGHGRGSSSGRHPQGRVRPHGRRRAEGLEGGRSALRGPGGVPRRGLARGARPHLGGAFHELVRPAGPPLRRRWTGAGRRSGATSPTRASPARTSGTTARRTRGSSPACGTSSRRPPTRTPCSRASRTRRCSGRSTAAAPGRSSPACASTAPDRTGSPARAACACTRSCPTRATPTACSSRSRRRACSAPTTAARPGGRPTRAW